MRLSKHGILTSVAFGKTLSKVANPAAMSYGRKRLSASSSGSYSSPSYAIFGGGVNDGGDLTTIGTAVDAYNTSLTHSTTTMSSQHASEWVTYAASQAGVYGLFAGGFSYDSYTAIAIVDAYNASMTRSNPTALSSARIRCAGATCSDPINTSPVALIGGGDTNYNSGSPVATVDSYSTALARTTIGNLPTTVVGAAAAGSTSNGHAIFSSTTWAAAYTSGTLTMNQLTKAYTDGQASIVGFGVGVYVCFAGGYTAAGVSSSAVEAYNASLTRSTPTVLSSPRSLYMAASNFGSQDMALVAGGGMIEDQENMTIGYAVVDAYDSNLVRSVPAAMSIGRVFHAAAFVGNYLLAAGGEASDSYGNQPTAVDAYQYA